MEPGCSAPSFNLVCDRSDANHRRLPAGAPRNRVDSRPDDGRVPRSGRGGCFGTDGCQLRIPDSGARDGPWAGRRQSHRYRQFMARCTPAKTPRAITRAGRNRARWRLRLFRRSSHPFRGGSFDSCRTGTTSARWICLLAPSGQSPGCPMIRLRPCTRRDRSLPHDRFWHSAGFPPLASELTSDETVVRILDVRFLDSPLGEGDEELRGGGLFGVRVRIDRQGRILDDRLGN